MAAVLRGYLNRKAYPNPYVSGGCYFEAQALSNPLTAGPFRGLPPSDPAGPPDTNAGNALRPSPAFLLLPPHAASPQFKSCRRAILELLKLSGP